MKHKWWFIYWALPTCNTYLCNISWPTVRIESYLVAIAEFRFHFHLNHASLLRDVTNKVFANTFRFKLTLFSTWLYNWSLEIRVDDCTLHDLIWTNLLTFFPHPLKSYRLQLADWVWGWPSNSVWGQSSIKQMYHWV